MPVEYHKNSAVFVDLVAVDEAEGLLSWLQEKPKARINLSRCTHLHAANLQVLMAAKRPVSEWPSDQGLSAILKSALSL